MSTGTHALRTLSAAVAFIFIVPGLAACHEDAVPTATDFDVVVRLHSSKEADFHAEVSRCDATVVKASQRAPDLPEISGFKKVTELPAFTQPETPTTPQQITEAIAEVKEQSKELTTRTQEVEAACNALKKALGTREQAKWGEATKKLQEALDAGRSQDRTGAPHLLSEALDAALIEGDKALNGKGDFAASEAAVKAAENIDAAHAALINGIVPTTDSTSTDTGPSETSTPLTPQTDTGPTPSEPAPQPPTVPTEETPNNSTSEEEPSDPDPSPEPGPETPPEAETPGSNQ